MIQKGTYLNIIDNSGAKVASCIRIITKHKAKIAGVGDTILVTIKRVRPQRRDPTKIAKGKIFKALILRTRVHSILGKVDNTVKFMENAAILLTPQNKLVGSRVLGVVSKEFRYTKFAKLLILATGIV